jgi:SAM-dependent methyltransferase
MSENDDARRGLDWQRGVWNRMSGVYEHEIDRRFAPVVEGVITRAAIRPGERVLDLGTGTGAVALRAADRVGRGGAVVGVDISAAMLGIAGRNAKASGFENVSLREGRAEAIPCDDAEFDAVLASLSLMYAVDRAAGAREIARVMKPGGRFVAAVWAGPERCDIVRFQETAGRFAGPPPVPGVGPGALADPGAFLDQLEAAGIDAHVETEALEFDFPDFGSAWDALARVTAALLAPERREEARAAVLSEMWPDGDGARSFRNETHFLTGVRGARGPKP